MSQAIEINLKHHIEELGWVKPVFDNTIDVPEHSSAFSSQLVSLCGDKIYGGIEKICTISSTVVSG